MKRRSCQCSKNNFMWMRNRWIIWFKWWCYTSTSNNFYICKREGDSGNDMIFCLLCFIFVCVICLYLCLYFVCLFCALFYCEFLVFCLLYCWFCFLFAFFFIWVGHIPNWKCRRVAPVCSDIILARQELLISRLTDNEFAQWAPPFFLKNF